MAKVPETNLEPSPGIVEATVPTERVIVRGHYRSFLSDIDSRMQSVGAEPQTAEAKDFRSFLAYMRGVVAAKLEHLGEGD